MINVLLLTQMYSSENFTGISMVNYYRDIISSLNKKYPGEFHWNFAVPSVRDYVKWEDEELIIDDSVKLVPILPKDKCNRSKVKDGFAGQNYAWYSPPAFKYFASADYLLNDVVLSNFYHAGMVINMQLGSFLEKQYKLIPKVGQPSIVNLLMETGVDGTLPSLNTRIGKICIMATALAADCTVFFNKFDEDWFKTYGKNMVAKSEIRNMDMRTILAPIDMSKIPVIERPENRAVFFHGGTFEGKRHIPALVKMVGDAYAITNSCKFIISTQYEKKVIPEWAYTPFTDIRPDSKRSDYLSYFPEGDFLLCAADYEGTGLAYMEAILSGMTPIILKRQWICERVPSDYKFLCDSENDMAQAIMYCAKNPQEAKQAGKYVIEHLKKYFDKDIIADTWYKLLTDMAAIRNEKSNKLSGTHFLGALAKKVLSDIPQKDEEFLENMANASDKLDVKSLCHQWPFIRAMLLGMGIVESPNGWRL